MRVNSYNKFFMAVAKIMNTEVKSVKPIEGRYKVELVNHVYLNVYRGVSGSLFIHDHRGIAHITSCYDFDDFKTMKELYERLMADYSGQSEESIADTIMTDDCMKTVLNMEELFSQMFGNTIRSKCKMYNNSSYGCPADMQGNRCGGKQWCKQTWKRYGAIVNPEWHHVSIATLANIDNDMLDAKRQCYMYVYRLLKDFRKYAFETSRREVYFDLVRKVIKEIQQGYFNNKISIKAYNYACRHIESVSVEKNYFTSNSEQAFGYKESKRYKITLR